MSVFWLCKKWGKDVINAERQIYKRRIVMTYNRILIFIKKGDLLDYLETERVRRSFPNMSDSVKQYYAQEREIQLVARIRWETNGQSGKEKCICNIK